MKSPIHLNAQMGLAQITQRHQGEALLQCGEVGRNSDVVRVESTSPFLAFVRGRGKMTDREGKGARNIPRGETLWRFAFILNLQGVNELT